MNDTYCSPRRIGKSDKLAECVKPGDYIMLDIGYGAPDFQPCLVLSKKAGPGLFGVFEISFTVTSPDGHTFETCWFGTGHTVETVPKPSHRNPTS